MVIDFHAHILPGADHGSRNSETTQKQLQMIAAAGTDAVVATPHFYPHRDNINAFLARREAALSRLLACKLPEGLCIYLGAEVQVCEGLEELEELEALCVRGTNVILLEMPFGEWSRRLTDTVLAIADRGLVPVLAHVDRYPKKMITALLQRGITAQLNAEPFLGFFGRRRAKYYLKTDSVVALGSDLHGADLGGYGHFFEMRRRLGEAADGIFARAAALLKNAKDVTGDPVEGGTV